MHSSALRRPTAIFYFVVGLLLVAASDAAAQDRSGPFTHEPRSLRSRAFDQQHVRLELTFDFDRQHIDGRAVHDLVLLKAARTLELDAADMKIVKVAGRTGGPSEPQAWKFTHRERSLQVELPDELPAGRVVELSIDYEIDKPRHGAHFVTPDDDEPGQQRMVWTQSEPEYARYWFPCFDHPADRLTSEIVATVPAGMVTLSNGVLADKQDAGDAAIRWHWRQAKSHAPYLLSIVAGDFEVLEQSASGIPVQSYVPRGRLADAPRSFEKTPAMLEYFSKQIGYGYPWTKYAQICVDEYGWGGMEHTSATTLNLGTLHDERAHLDVSSESLVAHELVHQWFGDLLTCKDWGELWLNESFATYFATLWTEHDRGWDEASWERRGDAASYLTEDARYRRPIVSFRYNQPANMFDRHSYPKGGRVLHMLRFELGDELFWKAIRRYVEINQFRTVETADLRTAIEESTGQGLNWFFDQWLYRGGHPEFHVTWDWDSIGKQVQVTVKQTQKVDSTTPPFRTSAEIEVALPAETFTRRVTLSKAEETFHFDAQQRPTRVVFDPKDWILKKLVAPKSKAELLDQLDRDEHAMVRTAAAEALAEHASDDDAAAALAAALKSDAFFGVRQEAAKALAKGQGDASRKALLQAARSDAKSHVRREAFRALQKYKHDETSKTAREAIEKDSSYFTVAAALECLVHVDRDNCKSDLLAALDRRSHDEVILKAACDGLVELKEARSAAELSKRLTKDATPQRKGVLIAALARLQPDDEAALDRLHGLLDNDRANVRRAAVEALGKIGAAGSLDELLEQRNHEEIPGNLNALDEAVAKIRTRLAEPESLRKELEKLREQNEQLEERLKKLEAAP